MNVTNQSFRVFPGRENCREIKLNAREKLLKTNIMKVTHVEDRRPNMCQPIIPEEESQTHLAEDI